MSIQPWCFQGYVSCLYISTPFPFFGEQCSYWFNVVVNFSFIGMFRSWDEYCTQLRAARNVISRYIKLIKTRILSLAILVINVSMYCILTSPTFHKEFKEGIIRIQIIIIATFDINVLCNWSALEFLMNDINNIVIICCYYLRVFVMVTHIYLHIDENGND
jgi:hypothetical protein